MLGTKEQKILVRKRCVKWKTRPDIPLSALQLQYPKHAPARGLIWISHTCFPPPHDAAGIRNALQHAFERLRSCDQQRLSVRNTQMENVKIEWIGPRLKAESSASEPGMSERQKYKALEHGCEKEKTILYVHGGAF